MSNTPSRINEFLLTVHLRQRKVFHCAICKKPVSLEVAKSDEYGRWVHEDCYVLRLRMERRSG